MTPEVGVFQAKSNAERGIERVLMTGVRRNKINLLTPDSPDGDFARVPVSDTEQPGMGAAVGTVVGGALGSAGGFGAGSALASLMLPGVGPILAGGLFGAGLLGLTGAAGGAAVGDALEDAVSGLPHDEIYVYEDALRRGRTVVLVEPANELEAAAVRQELLDAGAETVDAARDQWWIGLRSAELESYAADGGDFDLDEAHYRKGFEAAQAPAVRGKSYEEALDYLTRRHQISAVHSAFRRGYERGRQYRDSVVSEPRQ